MQKNRKRLESVRDAVSDQDKVTRRPGGGDVSAYNLVQAVDRGVTIMEALAESPKGLTISELCTRLDMHKATVYRILSTLVYRGYVEEDLRTAVYKLTLKVFDLSRKVLRGLSLVEEAQPALDDLRRKTGETVDLAVVDRGELTIAQTSATLHDLSLRRQENVLPAAFRSAARKLLLANLAAQERSRVLEGKTGEELSSEGIASPAELETVLDLIRVQGFVIDDQVLGEGMRCVMAPVHNHLNDMVAVVSISVPVERAKMKRLLSLANDAVTVAKNLSAKLGHEAR